MKKREKNSQVRNNQNKMKKRILFNKRIKLSFSLLTACWALTFAPLEMSRSIASVFPSYEA